MPHELGGPAKSMEPHLSIEMLQELKDKGLSVDRVVMDEDTTTTARAKAKTSTSQRNPTKTMFSKISGRGSSS